MQQPATSPKPLGPAAWPPGTLHLSRHQPAGDHGIRPFAAQCADAYPRSAGLTPRNGSRFRIPRVEAEKQGRPARAAMMPPSPPTPPTPLSAGAAAGAR
ncbi:MAG: hypothetical protein ACRDNW_17435 [Trebonia sp.]